MYHIFMRNYPQPDIDITEEWEMMPFTKLNRANAFIADIEKIYADPGWDGHKLYRAKFYAEKVK